MIRSARLGALTCLLLAGCTEATEAVYDKAPPATDEARSLAFANMRADYIAMPLSKIMVAPETTSSPSPPSSDAQPTGTIQTRNDLNANDQATGVGAPQNAKGYSTFAATVVPSEGPHKYAVIAHNNIWSTSQIAITRQPNTDIPKEVDGTFTNTAAQNIKAVGGIITAVLAAGAAADLAPPQSQCQAEPLPAFVVVGTLGGGSVPGTRCWTYTISPAEGAVPSSGTVTYATFESRLGRPVAYFPVPACLDVVLEVNNPSQVKLDYPVRIVDPDRVRLTALPIKGKITMHPVCGADVSDQGAPNGLADFEAALAEAVAQANAIEAAQKKSTTSGSGS